MDVENHAQEKCAKSPCELPRYELFMTLSAVISTPSFFDKRGSEGLVENSAKFLS